MKLLSIFWHTVYANSIRPEHRGENPTVDLFREQIKFLTDNYTPISVAEFLQICQEKRLSRGYPKPPVLLGFDDGFKDVVRNAVPVLDEFNAPAVFFVVAEILHNPDFVPWYVERKHLIRKTVKKSIVYDNRLIELSSPRERAKLTGLFDVSFRACESEADRQRLLSSFAGVLGVDRPKGSDLDEDLEFVSRNDLATLASSSLLTVASHAMTHRDLASLGYDDQVYELEQSDLVLSEHCPSYYPVIAYPNGSFSRDTINIARGVYNAGFAVLLGSSYRHPYAYPRIGLGNDSVQELAYSISAKRLNYILPLKRFLHIAGIRREGSPLFQKGYV
jgi:peptidoglycan/xylan/chitin deacetylase (PgdA/CDA1 family)